MYSVVAFKHHFPPPTPCYDHLIAVEAMRNTHRGTLALRFLLPHSPMLPSTAQPSIHLDATMSQHHQGDAAERYADNGECPCTV
jgi:hypothetical protein